MSEPNGWFQIDAYQNQERGLRGLDVRFGPERVSEIGEYARDRGLRRAMLVTGSHVSQNAAAMDPIRDSLGDLLAGEFFEASRGKHITSVYDGIEKMREVRADLLIGIGGGGSLDTARQISAFAADGRPRAHFQATARRGESLSLEGEGTAQVMLVPTTLAGADLSVGGSIEVLSGDESPDGRPKRMNPPNVSPIAVFYDPRLYESSPRGVLTGSAMNGLDKGIETIYSPLADPYSDAVGSHGLALMARGLLTLGRDARAGLVDAVAGMILIQLRVRISIIHAFGHAIARNSRIQQGIAHAVVVPHVIRFLMDREAFDPGLLELPLRAAGALPEGSSDVAEAVSRVRDSLGLPSRLSALDEAGALDLEVCADHASHSGLLKGSPLGPELSARDALAILEQAW